MSLAGAYMLMGKRDKMLEYAHKALEIGSNNSVVLSSVITISYMENKYEEALNYLEALRTIPNDARDNRRDKKQQGLYFLVKCSYSLHKYEQAETLAKECIAVNPNSSFPYATLAETYSLMGKDEAFYEALEDALKHGILAKTLIEDAPYQRFLKKKRFKDLLKKYEQKTAPLDQIAKN